LSPGSRGGFSLTVSFCCSGRLVRTGVEIDQGMRAATGVGRGRMLVNVYESSARVDSRGAVGAWKSVSTLNWRKSSFERAITRQRERLTANAAAPSPAPLPKNGARAIGSRFSDGFPGRFGCSAKIRCRTEAGSS
jgi:hypothetical protein